MLNDLIGHLIMKLPEIMLALVSCISLKWPVTSEQTPKHGFFFPANNSLINKRIIFFTDPQQLCFSAFVQ